MNTAITTETQYSRVANPRRGYHDYITTVKFQYSAGEGHWTQERETEVVDSVVGRKGNMWYKHESRVVDETTHSVTYTVNHGYDSGD